MGFSFEFGKDNDIQIMFEYVIQHYDHTGMGSIVSKNKLILILLLFDRGWKIGMQVKNRHVR